MSSKDPEKVTISGRGDVSCYPDLLELAELLASLQVPIHLGYTSGKGFDSPQAAEKLINNNVREVSFTVFATDPGCANATWEIPPLRFHFNASRPFARPLTFMPPQLIVPGVNGRRRSPEKRVTILRAWAHGV